MRIVDHRDYRCPHCRVWYRRAFSHPTLGPVCPICVRKIELAPGQRVHVEDTIGKRARIVRASTRTLSKIRRLAERDGWVCHLCGDPIDPRARGQRGASLDHVIPRSMGGSNGLDNLKLSHLVCNNRRGNTPMEEVRAHA